MSSGLEPQKRSYAETVESSEVLERFPAHHRPFYDRLRRQRLVVL